MTAYFAEGRHSVAPRSLRISGGEVGLDRSYVTRAIETGAHQAEVQADRAEAGRLGITGRRSSSSEATASPVHKPRPRSPRRSFAPVPRLTPGDHSDAIHAAWARRTNLHRRHLPTAVTNTANPHPLHDKEPTLTTLSEIPFLRADGTPTTLAEYAGRVVLVVNTASKCGLTPQYESLQQLYDDHQDDGLMVLGFPANDFLGQEPGTDQEIADFCSTHYAVTFPVMSKISVLGPTQHPLYAALTAEISSADGKGEFRSQLRQYGTTPTEDPDVLWNFEKFLVSREGRVVGRFAPGTTAADPALLGAVRAELKPLGAAS